MEIDLQLWMASKAADEYREYILFLEEEMARKVMAIEDAKMKEMMIEEMNMMKKKKMLRRRRERLMRHFRRAKKKVSKSQDSESFTSDSDDEEMKEEVKRLIRETLIEGSKAEEMKKIEEDSKAEEMKKIEEDDKMAEDSKEKMFPRRRGRLIRYVRRHSSKSQEEDFHIEFHHLQLPSDDEDDEI